MRTTRNVEPFEHLLTWLRSFLKDWQILFLLNEILEGNWISIEALRKLLFYFVECESSQTTEVAWEIEIDDISCTKRILKAIKWILWAGLKYLIRPIVDSNLKLQSKKIKLIKIHVDVKYCWLKWSSAETSKGKSKCNSQAQLN